MELIPLECPRCAAALPTAAGRRIFVCAACGTTSVVPPAARGRGAARLLEIPRVVVRPRLPWPPVGSIVLLPVWVVPILRSQLPGAADHLPAEVRLPALGYDRLEVLLRYAVHLTQVEIPWEPLDPEPAPALLAHAAAELTAEEAVIATTPVLHALAGTAEAIASAESIPLGAPALVDLPCQHVGGRISDLVCGRWASDVLLGAAVLPDQRAALVSALEAAPS